MLIPNSSHTFVLVQFVLLHSLLLSGNIAQIELVFMMDPTSLTDKKKKKITLTSISISLKGDKKIQTASPLTVSNFSPFHLGCPLCCSSLLSPLLQLILQNWRMGGSVRVGFCCWCVCDSAGISACAWVEVPNSHVDISMLLLCSVLSLMGDVPGGSLTDAE